ncbi:MAG: hypothetical protein ACREQ1_15320, partial [Woeseiaceae bacterium]
RLETLFAEVRNESGAFNDEQEQGQARTVASDALGVPVRVLLGDSFEIYSRARVVRNTVVPDPEMPTLAEVREMLDAPPLDESLDEALAESVEEPVDEPANKTVEKAKAVEPAAEPQKSSADGAPNAVAAPSGSLSLGRAEVEE